MKKQSGNKEKFITLHAFLSVFKRYKGYMLQLSTKYYDVYAIDVKAIKEISIIKTDYYKSLQIVGKKTIIEVYFENLEDIELYNKISDKYNINKHCINILFED